MATSIGMLLGLTVVTLVVIALVMVLAKVIGGVFVGIGWVFRHVFSFVFGVIQDVFRLLGAIIAGVVFSVLIALNILIGRWSSAKHFGSAMHTEIKTFTGCLYRILIGRPAKFLLLNGLLEGIEQRVPQAIEQAPGSDRPSKKTGTFDGYTIVGSLKGGGSGGRLYVAEPDPAKLASLERQGFQDVDQVVIKSFSLRDGSSLPQIIRESRALEAARKLGLILEHEQANDRFFYVMRYVPGETLTAVTTRMHAQAESAGLDTHDLRVVCTYIAQLLTTLGVYHKGGLWHKDIKPDNIIVHDGEAHVVDLGLVTPLRSAMTLTTHGTEYFRDPELVRMAIRGAKVHEVDGVKFDIYGAGAVLFSMVEDSFPAHGGLSTVTKRCPDALRWIIRRAMAETSQRYTSADEMLLDLRAVIAADDPFAMKPKDLPSMGGVAPDGDLAPVRAVEDADVIAAAFAPASVGGVRERTVDPSGLAGEPGAGGRPSIRVVDWLTGGFVADQPVASGSRGAAPAREPLRAVKPVSFRTAAEQRERASARARAARQRAHERMARRGGAVKPQNRYNNSPTVGLVVGAVLGVGILLLLAAALVMPALNIGTSNAKAMLAEREAARAEAEATRIVATTLVTTRETANVFAVLGDEDYDTAPAESRDLDGVRVLNVTTMPIYTGDTEQERLVNTVLGRLGRDGATVVGFGTVSPAVELTAPVLATLGVVSNGITPQSRELVRDMLRTRAEAGPEASADAVVVVHPAVGEKQSALSVIGVNDDVEDAVRDALIAYPEATPAPASIRPPTPPVPPAVSRSEIIGVPESDAGPRTMRFIDGNGNEIVVPIGVDWSEYTKRWESLSDEVEAVIERAVAG